MLALMDEQGPSSCFINHMLHFNCLKLATYLFINQNSRENFNKFSSQTIITNVVKNYWGARKRTEYHNELKWRYNQKTNMWNDI